MKIRITNDAQCTEAVEELELTSLFVEQRSNELRSEGLPESEIYATITPLIDHALDLYQEIVGYEDSRDAILN